MSRLKINNIDVTKLTISIIFYCVVEPEKYDLGSLQLKQGNKDLILDVTSTIWNNENHHTEVICTLEFDKELSDDFNNNMLFADLYNKMDSATLYIGTEYEIEPESIDLAIRDNGNTTMVELSID
jgi:hypothetical protein